MARNRKDENPLARRARENATIGLTARMVDAAIRLHYERYHRPWWVRWRRRIQGKVPQLDLEMVLTEPKREEIARIDAMGQIVKPGENGGDQ
jgi:hypothetical protein